MCTSFKHITGPLIYDMWVFFGGVGGNQKNSECISMSVSSYFGPVSILLKACSVALLPLLKS